MQWSCHTILSYSYVFSYQTDFKNLQSLEICGGGLTDAGVKNIKDLASLKLLNLSQNCNLTDKTLELASGIFCFSSLICFSAVALLNIIILLYLWYKWSQVWLRLLIVWSNLSLFLHFKSHLAGPGICINWVCVCKKNRQKLDLEFRFARNVVGSVSDINCRKKKRKRINVV